MRVFIRALVLMSCATVAAAQPVRTLADVTVTALDGQEISTTALAQPGRWVLVFVTPGSASCDDALAFWNGAAGETLAERTVVIVGRATLDEARALHARTPQLARAAWYADAGGAAAAALDARGAPVVFGLRDRSIDWTMQGALPIVRSVLTEWLR